MDRLTPENLGKLMVLYEHMVFVESVIWNINAFDQWGVELGKEIGVEVLERLSGQSGTGEMDASTERLMRAWRDAQSS
jgi:glucose-6-phosphate isomerase